MGDALESETVLTNKSRIAKLSRDTKNKVIFSLNQFLTIDWLKEAWKLTRKSGALGVDEQSAEEYGVNLEENLISLLERLKSGTYIAPKIRRHYIPKSDGSQRPLGIPTFEDKIAQKAIAMILEIIYEQDFLNCSFGFRPNRSAHQALREIRNQIMDHRATWVLDIDIQKFFDSIDHAELRKILDKRVCDGVIRRLIDKWLKAEIFYEGISTKPISGTPQGGVISPVLANIFLHTILDEWFENEVKPRIKSPGFMVRFCDDFVMGFEKRADAIRVFKVLPKRLEKFGLTMHEKKSHLVDFRSPPNKISKTKLKEFEGRIRKIQSFNFLGFSHIWHSSRNGYWVIYQVTMKSRYARGLLSIKQWCKFHRHESLKLQAKRLRQFLLGHYSYFGITGNHRRLRRFYREVTELWKKWLSRRARGQNVDWQQFNQLLQRHPLPKPKIIHQYYTANL